MAFVPALRFTHDCGTMGDGFVYRPLWKIYYHCRNGVSIAPNLSLSSDLLHRDLVAPRATL